MNWTPAAGGAGDLRGHQNIIKRLLVHVGEFNLGLVMCKLVGVGMQRALQGTRL